MAETIRCYRLPKRGGAVTECHDETFDVSAWVQRAYRAREVAWAERSGHEIARVGKLDGRWTWWSE